MKWLLLLIVSLGSFWSELPSLSLDFPPPGIGRGERDKALSEPQVRQLARSITVKVLSGDVWGSGVSIERQGNTDTILTNRHVFGYQSFQNWQIPTPDGKIQRGKAQINHRKNRNFARCPRGMRDRESVARNQVGFPQSISTNLTAIPCEPSSAVSRSLV